MTRYQIPANVKVRPGQIVTFCSGFGRFLRAEDRVSNGLGVQFRVQADGTLTRFFF